jgi:hypothetical protein
MILPDTILVAMIAGVVSLLVSLVGSLASLHQVRSSQKRLEREIRHEFAGRIYEQRIRLYPEGYRILGRLRRVRKPQYLPSPETLKIIKDEINKWVDQDAGIFLSKDALKAYWELRTALGKNPGSGGQYTEEQANKIWSARNNFRLQLRKDIGNLYTDDSNEVEEDYWEYL